MKTFYLSNRIPPLVAKLFPMLIRRLLAVGLALSSTALASPKPVTNVAIINLESREGVTKSLAELFSDVLRTELYKTGRFGVMNREDMDAILKELKFQQSGACDQTSCIVEMGQALGVRKMIAGSVGLYGTGYLINAKLIDIAKGENEILVTETLPKDAPKEPQATFRIVARKLAGLDASRESSDQRSSVDVKTEHRAWAFGAGAIFEGGEFQIPEFESKFGSGGFSPIFSLLWRSGGGLGLGVKGGPLVEHSGDMSIPQTGGSGNFQYPGPRETGFLVQPFVRYRFNRSKSRFSLQTGLLHKSFVLAGSPFWPEKALTFTGVDFAAGWEKDLGRHVEFQLEAGYCPGSPSFKGMPHFMAGLFYTP